VVLKVNLTWHNTLNTLLKQKRHSIKTVYVDQRQNNHMFLYMVDSRVFNNKFVNLQNMLKV